MSHFRQVLIKVELYTPFFYINMEFDTETRILGQPILLGVLGKHEQISKQDMVEKIIHPLISAMGRLPDKLYIPSEGTSSAYMTLWAEKANLEIQCVDADWRKLQRRAGIMRDARIQKESTHLLIFVGARSKTYEQTGIREAKKGKQVYLVDHDTLDLCEIVVEDA
jgi:hypothetical protein